MSKLYELREFETKLYSNIDIIDSLVDEYVSKIKNEYKQNINNIIKNICEGEGLNYDEIKEKYLSKASKDEVSSEILDKIDINNNIYYYEKKEHGKVYDIKLNIVGVYSNDNIIIN